MYFGGSDVRCAFITVACAGNIFNPDGNVELTKTILGFLERQLNISKET